MRGLSIVFVIFLVSYFALNDSLSASFLLAARSYFIWRVFWAAVTLLVMSLPCLFLSFVMIYNLQEKCVGSAIGLYVLIRSVILCLLVQSSYIFGAYLVKTAGTTDMKFADFNFIKLNLGVIMIVGIVFYKRIERPKGLE